MSEGMELTYLFRPRRIVSKEVEEAPDIYTPLPCQPWEALTPIGGLVNRGRPEVEAEYETDVRVCHSSRALYVAFRCADDRKVATKRIRHNQLNKQDDGRFDWVEILIDAGHDHMRALRVKLDANGHLVAWRVMRLRGELRNAVNTTEHELAHGGNLHSAVRVTDAGWEGAVEIPFARLGLGGGAHAGRVLGFDFERVAPSHSKHWRWAPGVASTDNTPLEFGDLYLGDAGWTVAEVDMERVLYEGSPLTLRLEPRGEGTGDVGLELTTRVIMPYDNETYDEQSVKMTAARGEPCELKSGYALSHRGRWPVEMDYTQRLEVELRDESSGASVYSGSFPYHTCLCIKPTDEYGAAEPAPEPDRSDAEFIKKKRAHIATHLPRFERRRTTDGAPSDFTLTAVDGSYEFDLMQAGALQRMADMVEDIFETEEDRLIAAALLIHQRTVTRHAGAYTRLFPLSPLSAMRAGGGICGVRSPILCGLVSLMKSPRTGEAYHTRVLEIAGHTITGVLDSGEQPDSEMIILDADIGLFFYPHDNSRLATLADLERDWTIPYRSNVNNFKYDHEMYSDPKFHHTHGWPYHGSFPEGAPEW